MILSFSLRQSCSSPHALDDRSGNTACLFRFYTDNESTCGTTSNINSAYDRLDIIIFCRRRFVAYVKPTGRSWSQSQLHLQFRFLGFVKKRTKRIIVISVTTKSQQLVLAKMHSLNYVSAIVEHSFYILRIDGARKMWITVMFSVSARRAYTLKKFHNYFSSSR